MLKSVLSKGAIDPTIALLSIYHKELKTGTQTNSRTWMFIAQFTRAQGWKPMSLSGWWINKTWVLSIIYPYSGILLSHKKKCCWMLQQGWNLENSIKEARHKRCYFVFVLYCMIPFLWNIRNRQTHRCKKQPGGRQGLGWGEGEWLLNVYGVFFQGDESVLEPDRSGGYTTRRRMHRPLLNRTLENGGLYVMWISPQ